MKTSPAETCDVVIVGGAISGAAAALMLLRRNPGLRVLIVERSAVLKRRVGEATVEVSTYFLSRVLGLTQYLNEEHLVKQGLRFWFHDRPERGFEECSEIGGRYLARVPAYQVDRATLDEEVLRRAVAAGAELWRPATVEKVELNRGSAQQLTIRRESESAARTVTTRWVIDASGVAALLARQEGWWRLNEEHPTAAAWARWRGVADFDGVELAERHPEFASACHGIRGTATNHFMGNGWWAWCIPLKGGDVSVGVVLDQRMVAWPQEGSLADRIKSFLSMHPVARELMEHAVPVEGDAHWRKNLAYSSTTYAGDGFVLVGDAAAFLDPFYSPGLDWTSFTVTSAVELISAQLAGEAVGGRVENFNRTFRRSYQRWFEGVYKDKYDYFGEYDLMRLAFLLDLGLYYLGVASQPFRRGLKALTEPVFSTGPSVPFYHLMRTYNRRFAAMARSRRQRNRHQRHNAGRRFMFPGYTFERGSAGPILRALLGWSWLEMTEGWRSWSSPTVRVKAASVSLPEGQVQSAGAGSAH